MFLEYFSLIAKFICSKFDTNQKYFCMSKTLKPQEWIVLVFFKHPFFTKCAPFLLKIGEDLTLMIRKAKGVKLMIFFITHLST
jgi:hypothetical protein